MLKQYFYCGCIIGYLVQFVQCNTNSSEFEIKCISCISNNCTSKLCGCITGWKLVDDSCEPVCSPSCFNGICVAPGKCKCYPGYEPPRGPRWKALAAYTCLPYSTTSTTTELPSFANTTDYRTTSTTSFSYKATEGKTEPTKTTLKEAVTTESSVFNTIRIMYGLGNTTMDDLTSTTEASATTTEIAGTVNECQNTWMYVVIGLLVLLTVLLIALLVFRKNLYICVKGGSYVVEEQPPKRSRQNSFNITFSSISKN